MIFKCEQKDFNEIHEIINDAASAYKGVIPADRWHEPYMTSDELKKQIDEGVQFWGYAEDGKITGVMGIQFKEDVTLIRHAYVRTTNRNKGIGSRLLEHLYTISTTPVLIGTWEDARWAIAFYEKHGFRLLPKEEKNQLLKKYWTIPARQIETSVVLASADWEKKVHIREAEQADIIASIELVSEPGYETTDDEMKTRLKKAITMDRVIIRKAVSNDLEQLYAFEQGIVQTERPFDPTLKKERIHYYDLKEMINDPDIAVVVAELNDKIIGSGYARIEKSKPYVKHQYHAYLGFMYVLPEHRGKGINRKIVDNLKNWASKQNVKELRLEVYNNNIPAIKAYEKIGFSKHMIEMRLNLEKE